MTHNIIETNHHRKIIVHPGWNGEGSKFLKVENTLNDSYEQAVLSGDNAKEIAGALLGNNVAVITDLPEVLRESDGYLLAGAGTGRYEDSIPESIEKQAAGLLAIAKFIRKANAEKEAAAEAQKAKEAEAAKAEKDREDKLTERRDALASELIGFGATYASRVKPYQTAIDRIIELEDAAEASKYVPF